MTVDTAQHLIRPGDGTVTTFGHFTLHRLVDADRTDGAAVILDHVLAPRALGAPVHTHAYTVEISIVTGGRFGVRIGDDEFEAGPGDVVVKPPRIPHTFWNASDEESRLVEIITPPGFDRYLEAMGGAWGEQGPDFDRIGELVAEHDIEPDLDSIPALVAAHGLRYL